MGKIWNYFTSGWNDDVDEIVDAKYGDMWDEYEDKYTMTDDNRWRITKREKAEAIEFIEKYGFLPTGSKPDGIDAATWNEAKSAYDDLGIWDNAEGVDRQAASWMEDFITNNEEALVQHNLGVQEEQAGGSIYDNAASEEEQALLEEGIREEELAAKLENVGQLEDKDYQRVDELFKMSETNIVDEIRGLEDKAALGSLALEETQEKFGVSGGMALAQYNDFRMGVDREARGLHSKMNNLGVEKQLFTDELSTRKTQEDRESLLFEAEFELLTNNNRIANANATTAEYAANNPIDYDTLYDLD